MGRIRDKEGYERLGAFVDEVVESSLAEHGWSWLDDAQQPEAREARLGELREIVRTARRTEPECAGLSARRRWLAMAYDEAVERFTERRPTRRRPTRRRRRTRQPDPDTVSRAQEARATPGTPAAPLEDPPARPETAVPRRPTAQERSLASRALVDALTALDPVLVMAVSRDDVASAIEAICGGGSTPAEEAERLALAHGRLRDPLVLKSQLKGTYSRTGLVDCLHVTS